MKVLIFSILAASMLFAYAAKPDSKQQENEPLPEIKTAENVTFNRGVIIANYPDQCAFFTLYFSDVCDAAIDGKPYTVPGKAFMIGRDEWLTVDTTAGDPATADYIRLNAATGFCTARLQGKTFHIIP